MKKMVVAILIVASIFALVGCAPAVVTDTATLESVNCKAAEYTVLVNIDENSKVYVLDSESGIYHEAIAVSEGEYGIMYYEKKLVAGSNKDSFVFTYIGGIGETGAEDPAKVYIGVLNSDAKSFKTKYAEITFKASAKWTPAEPVAVALDTNTVTIEKTFGFPGDKIFVDGVEYDNPIFVETATEEIFGTLNIDFTKEKTGVTFFFGDAYAAVDENVSSKTYKVEVESEDVVVATYNVVCSHIKTAEL